MLDSIFAPPAWVAQAHCADTSIPDAWFSESYDERRYAQSVCAGCPVKRDCLQYGIDSGAVNGIWGGRPFSSPKSRKKAREDVAA